MAEYSQQELATLSYEKERQERRQKVEQEGLKQQPHPLLKGREDTHELKIKVALYQIDGGSIEIDNVKTVQFKDGTIAIAYQEELSAEMASVQSNLPYTMFVRAAPKYKQ